MSELDVSVLVVPYRPRVVRGKVCTTIAAIECRSADDEKQLYDTADR